MTDFSDEQLNSLPPHERKRAINDYLKLTGKTTPLTTLTPEQSITRQAMGIWDQVLRNVAKPLLKGMKKPSDYIPAGTQHILVDAFKSRFNHMSKDELVSLVSIMHGEELEKQCAQCANAGMIGEHMDNPS